MDYDVGKERGERKKKKQFQSGDLSEHWNSPFRMLVLLEWPVGIFFLFNLWM